MTARPQRQTTVAGERQCQPRERTRAGRRQEGHEGADGNVGLLRGAVGSGDRLGDELGGGGMSRGLVAADPALGRAGVTKVLHPALEGGRLAERANGVPRAGAAYTSSTSAWRNTGSYQLRNAVR